MGSERELETALRGAAGVDVAAAAAQAQRRAVPAAEDAGLVDVAVTTMDSPVGELLLAVTRRGLVRINFGSIDAAIDDLARRLSPRLVESPRRLDAVRRELDEYFEGRRRRFDLRVDWSLRHGFQRKALQAARRIPIGETATYGELAARAGSPRAARAVGTAMATNPVPLVVPCHRVVPAGGGLGNYGGGVDKKAWLLRLEGSPLGRQP